MSLLLFVSEYSKRMKEILEFNDKKSVYYSNVIRAIQKCKDMLAWYKENVDKIHTEVDDFLNTNRKEVWLRYFLAHGTKYLENGINDYRYSDTHIHEDFLSSWTACIPKDCKYNTNFSMAMYSVKRMNDRAKQTPDDPDILAIHAGKEHEGCWAFCWHCEDMEHAWTEKLRKEVQDTDNIFIKTSLQEDFIKDMLGNEAFSIPDTWKPPKFFGTTYDHDTYFKEILEYRKDYTRDGQTPVQCMRYVIERIDWYEKGWVLRTYPTPKTEYDAFFMLWSRIDTLLEIMEIDVRRCLEIETYF